MTQTLHSRAHGLSSPQEQLRVLNDPASPLAIFDESLKTSGFYPLAATGIDVFQINVGKLCNQVCRHCHVDAGPDRTEMMTRETAELCIQALAQTEASRVDLTGGAPELNPQFRYLVEESRALGRKVMDRCNLTVLLINGQKDLGRFLADNQVEVIASLPYFLAEKTDSQRGDGIFDKSVRALRLLNELGYGQENSGLELNLVYNPTGAFLPPDQAELERDFKRELLDRYGIVFNSLFAITNMPISRFLEFLDGAGLYSRYMTRLINAYNPAAVEGVMCRSTLSVGWDGQLYDCDFNQMLQLPTGFGAPRHIRDFVAGDLAARRIVTGRHCYGCTAGSGSSCGGETA